MEKLSQALATCHRALDKEASYFEVYGYLKSSELAFTKALYSDEELEEFITSHSDNRDILINHIAIRLSVMENR